MPEPAPIPNDNVHITDEVISDLKKRKEFGLAKYGTYLQPFNGRNPLQDAYEEVLDLAQYLKQALLEQQANHERSRGEGKD